MLVGNVDSSDSHRVARKCAGTGGHCSVSGQKLVHPKGRASRSECDSSRDHTPSPFIFRACLDSHHERTTIPENTSFGWVGDHSLNVKTTPQKTRFRSVKSTRN